MVNQNTGVSSSVVLRERKVHSQNCACPSPPKTPETHGACQMSLGPLSLLPPFEDDHLSFLSVSIHFTVFSIAIKQTLALRKNPPTNESHLRSLQAPSMSPRTRLFNASSSVLRFSLRPQGTFLCGHSARFRSNHQSSIISEVLSCCPPGIPR